MEFSSRNSVSAKMACIRMFLEWGYTYTGFWQITAWEEYHNTTNLWFLVVIQSSIYGRDITVFKNMLLVGPFINFLLIWNSNHINASLSYSWGSWCPTGHLHCCPCWGQCSGFALSPSGQIAATTKINFRGKLAVSQATVQLYCCFMLHQINDRYNIICWTRPAPMYMKITREPGLRVGYHDYS